MIRQPPRSTLERASAASDVYKRQKLDKDSSRAGHVQSCLNMGGPPSKPKYSLPTDSEQVPWGKGEKNPDEGSEKVPEIECLQAVGALRSDRVPFV